MTEPEGAPAENTEAKRGRPRSAETIERDNVILGAIPADGTGVTRKQIAETAGVDESKVYLSLYRLQRDGQATRVRENGVHAWKRVAADAA